MPTADQYERAAAALEGAQTAPASAPRGSRTHDVIDMLTQGATFGFGDEIQAGGQAAMDAILGRGGFGERYDQRLGEERASMDRFRQESPALATTLEIAGALPAGIGTGGLGLAASGARGAAALGRGALAGAGGGATYAAGTGEGVEDRAIKGALGAALGAPIGAAGAAVGRAIRGRGQKAADKATVAQAPTQEALKAEARTAYKAADEMGDTIAPDDFGGLVGKIGGMAKREGVDPILTPKVSRVVDLIGQRGDEAVGLDEMQIMRRQLGKAAESTEPSERRIATMMIEELDDFVDDMAPEAGSTLATARAAWQKAKKSEIVEEAISRAQERQAGVEAGLRNEFAALSRNKKKMRGFSAEEQGAIKAVARGDFTTNVMRRIGSMSAGSGQQRNFLNAAAGVSAGAGLGTLFGGPVVGALGAAAAPVIGYGAQQVARRGTQQRADLARALAAGAQRQPVAPGRGRAADELTRGTAVPAAALAFGGQR